MRGGFGCDFVGFVDQAARVDEFDWVECSGTGVALVSAGVVVSAVWASTLDEAVCEEPAGR